MKHTVIGLLLVSLITSCGDSSTSPSGSEISPSMLSVEFTGDSSKVDQDDRTVTTENASDRTAGLRITNGPKGNCEVTATWSMCTDISFNSYVLYRSDSSGISSNPSSAEVLGVFSDPNVTEYVDSDVEWAEEYYYALKTTDSDNNSVWSIETSITTPGSSPTQSTLVLKEVFWNYVDLYWSTCHDSDFISYCLFRSEAPNIEADTNLATRVATNTLAVDTTYFDTGVMDDVTYYYALMTMNNKGLASWSNEIEVETLPGIPDSVVVAVNVGGGPYGICSLPSGDYVYVANGSDDNVSVIRTSDNSIVATVNVGSVPNPICSLSSGDYVYVANYGSDNVSVIRTSDNSIHATVSVGDHPIAICALPSGDYVYVANSGIDDNVSVIRTSDNSNIATVDVGDRPCGICSLPSGDYVYVANGNDDNVSVIRTSDNSIATTVNVGDRPDGICSLPSGDYVYVTNQSDDNVSVIRTSDNSVVGTVNVGGYPRGICSLPSGDYVYVTNAYDDNVSIIRTSDNSIAATVSVGSNPQDVCSLPSGDYVYLTNPGDDVVSVLN